MVKKGKLIRLKLQMLWKSTSMKLSKPLAKYMEKTRGEIAKDIGVLVIRKDLLGTSARIVCPKEMTIHYREVIKRVIQNQICILRRKILKIPLDQIKPI